jgi:hypothetical protein
MTLAGRATQGNFHLKRCPIQAQIEESGPIPNFFLIIAISTPCTLHLRAQIKGMPFLFHVIMV